MNYAGSDVKRRPEGAGLSLSNLTQAKRLDVGLGLRLTALLDGEIELRGLAGRGAGLIGLG